MAWAVRCLSLLTGSEGLNLGISSVDPRLLLYTQGLMESIGTLIKQELERQERSVTWFAHKLSCHRTNVYDIFSRDNIDVALLIRISKILNHNFFKDISEDIEK